MPHLKRAFEEDASDLVSLELAGRAVLATEGPRAAKEYLRPHEPALLAAGGSLAWIGVCLRYGDLDGVRPHLMHFRRAPWAQYDWRRVRELLQALNRNEIPPLDFGCRVVVA